MFLEYGDFDLEKKRMKTTLVVTNKKNEQFHVEDKLCMVMVFANWCHFCKEVKGTYDELHQSHDEMLFFKINGSSDETSKSTEDELIQNFSKIVDDKIVFPSFYFFRNGVYVGKHTGENTMEGFNQSILSMKEPVFKMNGQIVEKSKSSSSGEEDDARIQRRAVRLVRKNQSLCLIFIKQIVNWNFFKDLFYWSVEKTMKIFSYKDCRKFFPKQLCSFVTILMSCYFFWIFLNLIYISKFMRSSGSSRMLTIFSTYLKQTQVIITEFVMLSVQDVTDASYSKKAKMMLSIYDQISSLVSQTTSEAYNSFVTFTLRQAGNEMLVRQILDTNLVKTAWNELGQAPLSEREEQMFLRLPENPVFSQKFSPEMMLSELPFSEQSSFAQDFVFPERSKILSSSIPRMIVDQFGSALKSLHIPVAEFRIPNLQLDLEELQTKTVETMNRELSVVGKASTEWVDWAAGGEPVKELSYEVGFNFRVGLNMPMIFMIMFLIIWTVIIKIKKMKSRRLEIQ